MKQLEAFSPFSLLRNPPVINESLRKINFPSWVAWHSFLLYSKAYGCAKIYEMIFLMIIIIKLSSVEIALQYLDP